MKDNLKIVSFIADLNFIKLDDINSCLLGTIVNMFNQLFKLTIIVRRGIKISQCSSSPDQICWNKKVDNKLNINCLKA